MSAGLLPLRPYQRECVDALHGAIRRGLRRPATVLPTGAGKTVVYAHLGHEWIGENRGRRVLVLAHTTELLDQGMGKWRSVAPGIRAGRVQANLNETLAPVVFASVQTLRTEKRRLMIRDVGLVIVDEAHHAVAPTYLAILEHYGALSGQATVVQNGGPAVAVGFTATMERGDDLALGKVWQDIAYSRSIADMINGWTGGDGTWQHGGYLVRPRGLHVQVDDLDLSQVRTTAGDYREGDLGRAMEESMAPEAIVKAIAEHADQRKILLFAPLVSTAQLIADALRAAGRSVGVIHGAMPAGERKALLDAFRAGSVQILAGCMVLTEGFDEPTADCVVIARPTRSSVLYKQMAGRVLRPSPGKVDALLLDVVGASKHHALISGVSLFGDEPEKAKPKSEKDQDDTATDFDGENPEELAQGQQDARTALGFGEFSGGLLATEIDLFAASPMAWLRTRAGIFFVAAGDRYIAITPGWFGGYDVMSMHKSQRETGRWVAQGVEDLSYAMAWAEADVTPAERSTATKERGWRASKPSAKMQAFAARLRLPVHQHMRAGELSSMITTALASQRIDSALPGWMVGRQ